MTGTAFVWHDSALFGALPAIVGRQRVVSAYSILISTSQVLHVGATALAGVLIAVIGARNALWIDAVCYAISAVMIGLIPRRLGGTRTPEVQPASLGTDIREGLRYVRRHPVVWPLTVSGFGSALASGALLGLVVVYGVRQLGLGANGIALRQQLTPDRLQGRVNVTARMIAYGGTPIGAAAGGFLADQINIRAALLLMTLCVAASATYAWASPLRHTDAAAISRMREEAEQPG